MEDVKEPGRLPETLVFRLGTLGMMIGERFAERIEPLNLKPKHAGLMAALSREPVSSQHDLAVRLGIAPSLVVSLADHLERLGAVERIRDPHDRRRQVLTLTSHGQALLSACTAEALAIDEEFTAPLTPEQNTVIHQALGVLAARTGLHT